MAFQAQLNFFNSDSPIAKVAFLLLVVIVFVFALRMGNPIVGILLNHQEVLI